MEEELGAWCQRWLGAEPAEVLFRSGYLSQVTGLRMVDGRGVVVKARPPAARLAGCMAVQAALAEAGFPCPRPLAVHDWDRAVAQPEAVVAGLASAVWPAAEQRACWAAGLWVRAFNAKKQRLDGGGPQLDRLAGEAPERAARAGIGTA